MKLEGDLLEVLQYCRIWADDVVDVMRHVKIERQSAGCGKDT
jgi:hypothetical protein